MSGHGQHSDHAGEHESRDFDFGLAVLWIPISLGILVAFLIVAVVWTTSAASREMLRKETTGLEQGRAAVESLRAEETEVLTTYETDKDGSVRIPIRRAMEILAKPPEQAENSENR